MRIVFGLVLLVGIALAGGAVYMAKNYIDRYEAALAAERAQQPEAIPLTTVYVAADRLEYGDMLTEESVQPIRWPEEAVPEGAFRVEAEDLFSDAGRRLVLRTMEKHEPILAGKVTEPGAPGGLTTRLAPGMRAFAIGVDVASGVSGFLRPGDRVDVYWTGRVDAPGASRGEVTKLIQTGIELVAVDQEADSSDVSGTTIARTVTVAATPQQVAALAQAQSTGRLSLSLVGANDDTVSQAVQVDQMGLLGIEPPPEAPAAAPEEDEECTIRTRRGSEVVNIEIPCTN